MDISEAIAKRKSVRAYLDKAVPADDLAKIVEAGRWAPNAGPFQISVVRNRGLRQSELPPCNWTLGLECQTGC